MPCMQMTGTSPPPALRLCADTAADAAPPPVLWSNPALLLQLIGGAMSFFMCLLVTASQWQGMTDRGPRLAMLAQCAVKLAVMVAVLCKPKLFWQHRCGCLQCLQCPVAVAAVLARSAPQPCRCTAAALHPSAAACCACCAWSMLTGPLLPCCAGRGPPHASASCSTCRLSCGDVG